MSGGGGISSVPAHIQNCVSFPFPPTAMGWNVGFASHFSPQVQVMMSEMLQAVVAAYQVYGLNAATSSCGNILMSPGTDSTDWGMREARRENQAVGDMLSKGAGLFNCRPVFVDLGLYSCIVSTYHITLFRAIEDRGPRVTAHGTEEAQELSIFAASRMSMESMEGCTMGLGRTLRSPAL